VGKQRVVLEDHGDLPLVPALPVHHLAHEADLAAVLVGVLEARQQAQGGGLPAA
jgi:hypothetical protein